MDGGRAWEFLARYGDKGAMLLRAILEAARARRGRPGPGDFDYRSVRSALARMGVSYNPAPLLGILEREFGLIETTYRSSGQHWWRILDRRGIEEALREYEGAPEPDPGDPRLRLLRIQFYSLNPGEIMDYLQRAASRRRLTRAEAERLRRIAFEDLPLLVRWLEEARSEYPDDLADEIAYAEEILELAEEAAARAGGARFRGPEAGAVGGARLEAPLRGREREPL